MKKAIVLAANYQYVEQVNTTIKSLFSHNREINLYLINSDFPSEWFINLNKRLSYFNSRVINCKVSEYSLSQYKTDISYTVFLRYFVSDFVKEDRALYLDCDIIVRENIDNLFTMDMEGYPIAAVEDQGARVYFSQTLFNAGVILIDNTYWKINNTKDYLISLTEELHDQVDMADQSILNIAFEDNWLHLPWHYNYIPNHIDFIDGVKQEDCHPSIIHYLTHRKPWDKLSKQLKRTDWWLYNGLDWSEVSFINQQKITFRDLDYTFDKPSVLIFTNSGDIEQIEAIISRLPEVHFVIASQVAVGDYLARLLQFENVQIYSALSDLYWIQRYLVETSNALLDINYGDEVDYIISKFKALDKPVFAFENTRHGEQGQLIFAQDDLDGMVKAIQNHIVKGE